MRHYMEKINCFKGMLICALAVCQTACVNNESLVGTWVHPVPGMPDIKQGFVLEEGGKASSVNMATLFYEAWKQEGASLILSGKSMGNRQVISFSDTLRIERLTWDSLVLKKGILTIRYAREAGEKTSGSNSSLSAAMDRKVLSVKGVLVIGPEVRSFKPEGSSEVYWLIDNTGELYREYDRITGGIKNGVPVQAELEVEDTGRSTEGFAASYKSVYHVHKVKRIYNRDTL